MVKFQELHSGNLLNLKANASDQFSYGKSTSQRLNFLKGYEVNE